MYNKKVLSKATAELDKAKAPKKPKDIITDPMGQWKYPGQVTRIPSNDITMKGVGYPVVGVANTGKRQIMLPGADYTFPGADYVDEYPQMKRGGQHNGDIFRQLPRKNIYMGESRSLSATNKLFTKNKLLMTYEHKLFNPKAKHFQDGGDKKASVEGYQDESMWLGDKYKDLGVTVSKGKISASAGNYFPMMTTDPQSNFNPYLNLAVDLGKDRNLSFDFQPDYTGINFTKAFQKGGANYKTHYGPEDKQSEYVKSKWIEPNYQHDSDGTYYDPITQTIHIASEHKNDKAKIEHEKMHHWQNLHGALRDSSSTPIMKKPHFLEDQNFEGGHYYDRRDKEAEYTKQDFLNSYPEARFIPDQVLNDKVIDPAMYNNPDSVEGEGRDYENYIESGGNSVFQKGGPQNTSGPRNIQPSFDYDDQQFHQNDPAGYDEFINGPGHAPDTYKLPNHPTFSKESKYSTDETPGGEWIENPNGSWKFKTSSTNRKNMSKQEMQEYFNKVEPGNNFEYQEGGYIELELSPDEIEEYKKGGFIVEDISVPELNQAQKGGIKNKYATHIGENGTVGTTTIHTDKKGNTTTKVQDSEGITHYKVKTKDGKVFYKQDASTAYPESNFVAPQTIHNADWQAAHSGKAEPVDEVWTLPIGMSSAGVRGAGALAKSLGSLATNAGKSSLAQATKSGTKALFNTAPKWAPGMTLGNAIGAGFASNALTDIATGKVVEPWKKASKSGKGSDYADAVAENLYTALDAIPLYGAAGKGVKQLSKYITAETPLKNAYKILPEGTFKNYSKLNTKGNSYRVAGHDAHKDFIESGVLRSKRNLPENATIFDRVNARSTGFPSFQKNYADLNYLPENGGVVFETGIPTYKRGQLNPVTGERIVGRHYAHRAIDPKTGKVLTEIPASDVNVYEGSAHWLKGHKNINPNGTASNISINNIKPLYQESLKPVEEQMMRVKPNLDKVLDYRMNKKDKIKIVQEEVWGDDVLHEDRNKLAQEREHMNANEFSDNWVSTNPEKYRETVKKIEDLHSKINKINDSAKTSVRKQMLAEDEIFHEVLQKHNLDKNAYFKHVISNNEQSKQIVATIKKDIDEGVKLKRLESYDYKMARTRTKQAQQEIDVLNKQQQVYEEELEKLIDPQFKNKIKKLYDESKVVIPEGQFKNRQTERLLRKGKIIHPEKEDEVFKTLSQEDQEYIMNNQDRIGGVNMYDQTLSLGSKKGRVKYVEELPEPGIIKKEIPLPKKPVKLTKPSTWKNILQKQKTVSQYEFDHSNTNPEDIHLLEVHEKNMISPYTVGEVTAHEKGHDHQKAYNEWIKLLQEYDDAYGYNVPHNKSELAQEFQNALVEPNLKDINNTKDNTAWLSAPGELHSDLNLVRYKVVRKYAKAHNMSIKKATKEIKKLETQGNIDLYYDYIKDPNINQHFKEDISNETKIKLLKFLPAVIPAIGVGINANTPKKEMKKGGIVTKLTPEEIQEYVNKGYIVEDH